MRERAKYVRERAKLHEGERAKDGRGPRMRERAKG
jgi:hypothetical protein